MDQPKLKLYGFTLLETGWELLSDRPISPKLKAIAPFRDALRRKT